MSGVRMAMRLRQSSAISVSWSVLTRRLRDHAPQRPDADILADRPQGKDAVILAVAGNQRDGRGHGGMPVAALRGKEEIAQDLRLALAAKPGEALPLRRDRRAVPCRRPACRCVARANGSPVWRLDASFASSSAESALATLPMAATRLSRVKSYAARSATTLPSRMTMMRSEALRISPSRCEIRMQEPPPCNEAADEVEELAGDDRIERGGRFVEDDELDRNVGHR